MSSGGNQTCSDCKKKQSNNIPDYYWRDYTGEIPLDAISGGFDINRKPTYIGQASFQKVGVIPGTIYSNKASMKIPSNGNGNICDIGVKILCGKNNECFVWENSDSKNLHLTTIGKHLVIGGFEDGKILNIGRAMYQGELVVGKVTGYEAEKAKLFFVYGEKEINVTSYQILSYKLS